MLLTISSGVFWGYISVLIIEMHLHRGVSHEAFKPSFVLKSFMRIYNWLCLGLDEQKWKEVHLRHHKKTDTSEDPHSPKNIGKRKLFFFYGLYYLREKTSLSQKKSLRSKILLFPVSYGLPSLFFLVICFGFWKAFLLWMVHKIYYIYTWNWLIAFGHKKLNNTWKPINLTSPVAVFLSWGQSLHAAHHRQPNSARLGKYDPCYWVLKWLTWLKLVKEMRV